ncbi:MAG: hypothetical protein ACOYMD_13735 [Paludibacter sp.]
MTKNIFFLVFSLLMIPVTFKAQTDVNLTNVGIEKNTKKDYTGWIFRRY